MMASAVLAHVLFLDRLVLNLHYGSDIVEARHLRLVDKVPDLVVSNGDVLPGGLDFLYGFLSSLFTFLGPICCFTGLWKMDKAFLSGRGTRFLVDFFSSLNDGENPPDGRFTECGVSIVDRLQLALDTQPQKCSFLLVWYDREDKFRAILDASECLKGRGHVAVVLFHFAAEMRRFLDFCDHEQENWRRLNGTEFQERFEGEALTGTAGIVLASQHGEQQLSSERDMVCILGDCHPLPAKDKQVLDSLVSLEWISAAFQFVSADETPIASIRSRGFFKEKLFLADGNRCFVESRFLQGLLNSERREYIMTAASDVSVNSAAEWIDINCVRTGGVRS